MRRGMLSHTAWASCVVRLTMLGNAKAFGSEMGRRIDSHAFSHIHGKKGESCQPSDHAKNNRSNDTRRTAPARAQRSLVRPQNMLLPHPRLQNLRKRQHRHPPARPHIPRPRPQLLRRPLPHNRNTSIRLAKARTQARTLTAKRFARQKNLRLVKNTPSGRHRAPRFNAGSPVLKSDTQPSPHPTHAPAPFLPPNPYLCIYKK